MFKLWGLYAYRLSQSYKSDMKAVENASAIRRYLMTLFSTSKVTGLSYVGIMSIVIVFSTLMTTIIKYTTKK